MTLKQSKNSSTSTESTSSVNPEFLRFNYRIYPNKYQTKLLSIFFGNARFVYNKALDYIAYQKEYYNRYVSYIELSGKFLNELKKVYDFLEDSPSQSLQQACKNCFIAFQRYYKKLAKHPKHKTKSNEQSICLPQGFELLESKVKLPKLGKVKTIFHRNLIGTPKSIILKKLACEQYFISVLCELSPKEALELYPQLPLEVDLDKCIGYDLSMTDYLVDSLGKHFDNPKFHEKSLKKLKKEQRKLSRKKDKSKNKNKQRVKLAKIYNKIRNQQVDFIGKLVKFLTCNDNQVICLETLKIQKLLKKGLSRIFKRHLINCNFYEFCRKMIYSSKKEAKHLVQVSQYFPSTILCDCGKVNHNIKLSDKVWECESCHVKHERDEFAAKKILKEGLRILRELGIKVKDNSEIGMVQPNFKPTIVSISSPDLLDLEIDRRIK